MVVKLDLVNGSCIEISALHRLSQRLKLFINESLVIREELEVILITILWVLAYSIRVG